MNRTKFFTLFFYFLFVKYYKSFFYKIQYFRWNERNIEDTSVPRIFKKFGFR